MRRRSEMASLSGLDLAECNARLGGVRERALAFAQVALDAARQGDGPRMARCLETAQRERRGLCLADQVVVLDRLARAAHATGAAAFARLLRCIAGDCARRVRRRDQRATAQAICDELASILDEERPRLTIVRSHGDTRWPGFPKPFETPMQSCA